MKSANSMQPGRTYPTNPPAGTMFYGADIPLPEAHQQMSTALDAGCNFLDTAEMYPIPQAAEHAGMSEAVVGSWLKHHRR